MKKKVIIIVFFALIPICRAQEGAVTFGYILGGVSKGGFIVGYNLTNDVAIEAHLGGLPHVLTYGLISKIRVKDGDNDHFMLVGITRIIGHNPKKETFRATGMNLGYRFELHADGGDLSYPFEFGICPFLKISNTTSNQQKEGSDSDPQKEKPDTMPFTIFLGAGIQGSTE
jgi:hypothetical protein